MPKLKTFEIELPTHFACAFINADISGLDESDEIELESIQDELRKLNLGYCLDVSENSELRVYKGLLTDVSVYTFIQH